MTEQQKIHVPEDPWYVFLREELGKQAEILSELRKDMNDRSVALGKVETKIDAAALSLTDLTKQMGNVQNELTALRTKAGFWGIVGGMISGGVAAVISFFSLVKGK